MLGFDTLSEMVKSRVRGKTMKRMLSTSCAIVCAISYQTRRNSIFIYALTQFPVFLSVRIRRRSARWSTGYRAISICHGGEQQIQASQGGTGWLNTIAASHRTLGHPNDSLSIHPSCNGLRTGRNGHRHAPRATQLRSTRQPVSHDWWCSSGFCMVCLSYDRRKNCYRYWNWCKFTSNESEFTQPALTWLVHLLLHPNISSGTQHGTRRTRTRRRRYRCVLGIGSCNCLLDRLWIHSHGQSNILGTLPSTSSPDRD